MESSPNNYAGIHDAFAGEETAKIALIPVPYGLDSRSRRGPEALLSAASRMPLYDIETDTEVHQNGIYLMPPLGGFDSPESMVEGVERTAGSLMDQKKFVSLIGGDHSVSIGSIRACLNRFERLTVLQLDAHANLHDRQAGSTCHPECAMYEASKRANLVQVGIRGMDISEKAHMKRENVFFAHERIKNPTWMDEALERMTRDVYLSIDLSVFDLSIMPGVTRPEPGGLLWDETLRFIRKVNKRRNIVGLDIVELAPADGDTASAFLAARLQHKVLSYIFKKRNKKND